MKDCHNTPFTGLNHSIANLDRRTFLRYLVAGIVITAIPMTIAEAKARVALIRVMPPFRPRFQVGRVAIQDVASILNLACDHVRSLAEFEPTCDECDEITDDVSSVLQSLIPITIVLRFDISFADMVAGQFDWNIAAPMTLVLHRVNDAAYKSLWQGAKV